MFLVNSCLGLFSAACLRRHPFSRSYGVNLPSSLTWVPSSALGFSPHLPVSVCGTGGCNLPRSFSWRCRLALFGTCFPSPSRLALLRGGFASPAGRALGPGLPIPGSGCLAASLHRSYDCRRYWNLNQLSIAYAFRPRLRSRLTLGGRPFPRKP